MYVCLQLGPFRWSFGHLPRPRVFLVRHGESAANVDRTLYTKIPDVKVPLTDLGHQQAALAGEVLGAHLQCHGKPRRMRLFHSEYTRARQTAGGVLQTLKPIVSTWGCQLDHRFDSRIHELEFGVASGLTPEQLDELGPLYKEAKRQSDLLRAHGAKFFDRRFGGESPADVEIRLRHFVSALYRDVKANGITDFVVVSHGLTNRVLAKLLLDKTYEGFEQEKNPRNCAIRLITPDRTDGGYLHFGGRTGIDGQQEDSPTEG